MRYGQGAATEMVATQKNDKLTAFALNVLGGSETEDGGVSFEDSFGTLSYLPHPSGLLCPDGKVIRTQTELRSSICRTEGINRKGLLQGQVLTLFGALDFGVRLFTRHRYGEYEESFNVLLHRATPFVHLTGRYTSLRINAAERYVSNVITGLQVGREAKPGTLRNTIEIGYDAPDGLREDASATERQVLAALLTPLARQGARRTEIERRREQASDRVVEAERALQVIEAELSALMAAPMT